jgi:hypothetical protein
MIFVRPCRSATIRTRLDAEAIRERLAFLASEAAPEGFDRLMANGYFLGGYVGPKEFKVDYKFNSSKNPQTYAVHGRVQETKDWRILRLKLTAHSPWLSGIEMVFLAAFVAFYVFTGEMPPGPAVAVFVVVTAIYAFANLMFIPDTVKQRVSSIVAAQVSGSVQIGDQWVVPR